MASEREKRWEKLKYQNILKRNKVTQDIFDNASIALGYELQKYKLKGEAYNFTWTKNKGLEKKVNAIIGKAATDLEENVAAGMVENWGLANQKNDELASIALRNAALTSGHRNAYFQNNVAALNAFINRTDANGLDLSKRVWNIRKQTKNEVKTFIANGLATGRNSASLGRDVKQFLNEPEKRFRRVRDPKTGKLKLSKAAKQYKPGRGVYRSSVKNAQRLTRTETNMAFRQADYERTQQLDFVTGITVHLSAMHPVTDICDYMQGDYPKGYKFTGWHPHCFCYQTTKLLNEDEFKTWVKSGRIQNKSLTSKIPVNAWNYVKANGEKYKNYNTVPYWLKDNHSLNTFFTKGAKYKPYVAEFTKVVKGKKVTKSGKLVDKTVTEKAYIEVEGYEEAKDAIVKYSKEVPEEITEAVRIYTGSTHDQINRWLRLPDGHDLKESLRDRKKTWERYTKEIQTYFEKAPRYKQPKDVDLWRGMRLRKDSDFGKQFVKNLKPGNSIDDPGFMSTSYEWNKADNFVDFRVPEYNHFKFMLKVKGSKKGIAVDNISKIKGEQEVLFNTGSEWIIDEVKPLKGDRWEVTIYEAE